MTNPEQRTREISSVYLIEQGPDDNVDKYIYDKLSPESFTHAKEIYDKFGDIADTIVHIPVLATTDSSKIYHSLSQYAKQRNCDKFTVLLGINWPQGEYPGSLYADEIARAQNDFGDQLDVRHYTQEYADPTIGEIRKDLWDTGLLLTRLNGIESAKNAVGINHDIDTDYINPLYIANVQRHYRHEKAFRAESRELLEPARTNITHSYPFKSHPMTARGILWQDLKNRQLDGVSAYEAGLVVPMETYAVKGGFGKNSKISETSTLIDGFGLLCGIRGTNMKTSPRRYIDRFPDQGFKKIWTDESFTAQDQCRDNGAVGADATFEQLETHIAETLKEDMHQWFYFTPHKVYYHSLSQLYKGSAYESEARSRERFEDTEKILYKEMILELSIQHLIAVRAMRTVVRSAHNTNLLLTVYTPEKCAPKPARWAN